MDDFEKYLSKQLSNPEFKKEWDALEEEYSQIRHEIDSESDNRTSAKIFTSFNIAPPIATF